MRIVKALAGLVALAACAAQRKVDTPDAPAAFARRELPPDVLARRAIAYSGYRAGQSPDTQTFPDEDQIAQDLALLGRDGYGFIRLFDAGPHAARVLKVIADRHLDLAVLQGAWIAGGQAAHDADNRAEIERCVALVAAYPDLIVAVSVGNETLDDWSNVKVAPAELAAYLADVRARVAVPVTTDDSWLPFALGQDGATSYADVVLVARAVDFLSLHVYAFSDAYYGGWDWKQEAVPPDQRPRARIAAAIAYTQASVREVRTTMAAHGLDRPIVIGEIGWKSATTATPASPPEQRIELDLASPASQQMFLDAETSWVYGATRDADSPTAAFTFEAFDEPWKGDDDGWGLYDADRAPKHI